MLSYCRTGNRGIRIILPGGTPEHIAFILIRPPPLPPHIPTWLASSMDMGIAWRTATMTARYSFFAADFSSAPSNLLPLPFHSSIHFESDSNFTRQTVVPFKKPATRRTLTKKPERREADTLSSSVVFLFRSRSSKAAALSLDSVSDHELALRI